MKDLSVSLDWTLPEGTKTLVFRKEKSGWLLLSENMLTSEEAVGWFTTAPSEIAGR